MSPTGYIIIREIKSAGFGFRNNKFYLPALFFADDGLLLATSVEEANNLIKVLHGIALKCGLEINNLKSEVIVFNQKENFNEIQNISVSESFKYLGVLINNKKDCFSLQKELIINKAQKLANLMPAVIYRSSNRLLVGKTFWKCVALPKLMYGITVIPLKEDFIMKLQRIENKALRFLFFAPKYTPICAIRGEVGISTMKTRIFKNKLNFTKHLLSTNNGLLNNITKTMIEQNRSPWSREINKIFDYANIDPNFLTNANKEEINIRLRKIDNLKWEQDLESKSSLHIYRSFKPKMIEESIYNNSNGSKLLFRCRTNTMNLNDRNRFSGGNTKCPGCSWEKEDLEHFLLDCPKYSHIRSGVPGLQQPYELERDNILEKILLFKPSKTNFKFEIMTYIRKIHSIRQRIINDES